MKKNLDENTLWQDKKRFLGMPLSFTKYIVDKDRLYLYTGLLTTEVNEILLYRILDVKSSITLGQRIFGVGTVTVYCADQNNRTIELKNIKKPTEVHKFLSNLVEQERVSRGIIGKEMYGTANVDMDHLNECDACHTPPII